MKITRYSGVLIIESPTLLITLATMSVGRESAKTVRGMALWPFIVVRNLGEVTPTLIRHEQIHLAQQFECCIIGLYLWSVIEGIYIRWRKGLSGQEAYLYRSVEQEAYRNQHDPNYLTRRPRFAFMRYMTDKKTITFLPHNLPNVIVGESWLL